MPKILSELSKIKYCPLCHKEWSIVEEEGKEGKMYFVCLNDLCMISIWVRDSALGQYEKMMEEEPVPCPNCGNPKMRMFFRSDGFLKFRCVKCNCTVEELDIDREKNLKKDLPIIEGP